MSDTLTIPENGEIYEAIEDFSITYKTTHLTSFSEGGEARFPAGERLIIDTCGINHLTVYCDAVNYKELEKLIVPEKTRLSSTYDGYYFHIAIKTLYKYCKKITPELAENSIT